MLLSPPDLSGSVRLLSILSNDSSVDEEEKLNVSSVDEEEEKLKVSSEDDDEEEEDMKVSSVEDETLIVSSIDEDEEEEEEILNVRWQSLALQLPLQILKTVLGNVSCLLLLG